MLATFLIMRKWNDYIELLSHSTQRECKTNMSWSHSHWGDIEFPTSSGSWASQLLHIQECLLSERASCDLPFNSYKINLLAPVIIWYFIFSHKYVYFLKECKTNLPHGSCRSLWPIHRFHGSLILPYIWNIMIALVLKKATIHYFLVTSAYISWSSNFAL